MARRWYVIGPRLFAPVILLGAWSIDTLSRIDACHAQVLSEGVSREAQVKLRDVERALRDAESFYENCTFRVHQSSVGRNEGREETTGRLWTKRTAGGLNVRREVDLSEGTVQFEIKRPDVTLIGKTVMTGPPHSPPQGVITRYDPTGSISTVLASPWYLAAIKNHSEPMTVRELVFEPQPWVHQDDPVTFEAHEAPDGTIYRIMAQRHPLNQEWGPVDYQIEFQLLYNTWVLRNYEKRSNFRGADGRQLSRVFTKTCHYDPLTIGGGLYPVLQEVSIRESFTGEAPHQFDVRFSDYDFTVPNDLEFDPAVYQIAFRTERESATGWRWIGLGGIVLCAIMIAVYYWRQR